MKAVTSRRSFIKDITLTGLTLGVVGSTSSLFAATKDVVKRIGIIGLDTSHSIEFTKIINTPAVGSAFSGFRIVAAYPYGSKDIESSVKRIAGYTEEIKKYGVKISGSIKELLDEVDFVLLETNDGRPRLQQALEVFKAGKPLFIDKPVAASLTDVIAIYDAAKKYNIPVFSSSSLRYINGANDTGKIGKVTGADVYGPAYLEKTHPDLFWYGIHAVEILFTVMGTGCKQVTRTFTDKSEVSTGVWHGDRIGTLRGMRYGSYEYGGNVFGEKGTLALGPYNGYAPLLQQIVQFFTTGKAPVTPEETIEIYAFMEAADESKRRQGKTVSIEKVLAKARRKAGKIEL
jgi:predicted dehydrogenase